MPTNPSVADLRGRLESAWQSFRDELSAPDQRRFDRLFEYVGLHSDADTAADARDAAGETTDAGAAHLYPDRVAKLLFAVDVEQERRLDDLDDRVAAIERDLNPDLRTGERAADGDEAGAARSAADSDGGEQADRAGDDD
ncbi:hypothetical protein [Halobaculum sp. P14]|uniref:hypothetical protein n=1 Tax=Halobaculum sp. P14 TaxID=3421638 RepID=UPI003EBAB240